MRKKIWQFLQDEKNQRMLALIGGGSAAAGGVGLSWCIFYLAPEAKPGPPQKSIEADCGGVAVGGDVSGGH